MLYNCKVKLNLFTDIETHRRCSSSGAMRSKIYDVDLAEYDPAPALGAFRLQIAMETP